MKPSPTSAAVQYPQPLTLALSDFARRATAARNGPTAYALSLLLAAVTLAGSMFYKDITHSFTAHLMGVSVSTLWHAAFYATTGLWLTGTLLALLCAAQKGRTRTFGVYSIAMNIAAATLAACTML
jgi:hypothetical protein